MTRALALAISALALSGCITGASSSPDEVMCTSDSECATGSCHDGVCVGPAALPFAAELIPPEGRTDLAVTEIQDLEVDANGFADLSFSPTVVVSGRVVIHGDDILSVAARLVFRRPSRIPGVADYVVRAIAQRDVIADVEAFSVRLPRPAVDATGKPIPEEWELTITPDDGTIYGGNTIGPTPNLQAPPDHVTLFIEDAVTEVVFPLIREEGVKQIRGFVQDAVGNGMAGMEVRAFGRYAPGRPLELASSTAVTDANGEFLILARVSWEDEFDLEVRPTTGVWAPTLRRTGVVVEDPPPDIVVTHQVDDVRYPAFAWPQEYALPVKGISSGGTPEPAQGTTLRVTTNLPSDNGDIVTYSADALVGLEGVALVQLIPAGDVGNRWYLVTAKPPVGSPFGAVWDAPIEVGQYEGTLAEIVLPTRTYVTGHLLGPDGAPATNVQVRASLSQAMIAALSPEEMARVGGLSFPDVQTDGNGDFGIYLDPSVLGLAALYDLECVPPLASLAPRWTWSLAVPSDAIVTHQSGEIRLPHASYAWGKVKDDAGNLVVGADLRVWLLPEAIDCVSYQPRGTCDPIARLAAQAKSDENGEVTMVLPREVPASH